MNNPLRCPYCSKFVGEWIDGKYKNTCPRCHRPFVIERVMNVDKRVLVRQ